MDREDPFIKGFEKAAANPWNWLRPLRRAKAYKRLGRMGDKAKKSQSRQEWLSQPVQKAKEEAAKPSMKAKKYLGWGLIGGGAGAYGLKELQNPPKTYFSRQSRYGVGRGTR